MKILVIGGGLFGTSVAIELSKLNYEVTLIEQDKALLKHASKANHNRLHLGYHYLRSKETAQQSINGLLSFLFYYGESVKHSFPNYYAIAKEGSLTTSQEFIDFCDQVGIDYDEEYPEDYIMARDQIETSFKVPEPIFDYAILKKLVEKRLGESKANVRFSSRCEDVVRLDEGYRVIINGKEEFYNIVVNTTYCNVNRINEMVGAPRKKIKFQDVIIPHFSFNREPFGLTIMDGPFCSVMPKGVEQNQFLLYHVKHSVLKSTVDYDYPDWNIDDEIDTGFIYDNSEKYYPFLRDVKHLDYWRTIRAIHENENDARVSELLTYKELPNYYTVLSGKISTCIQIALAIKHDIQGKKVPEMKII